MALWECWDASLLGEKAGFFPGGIYFKFSPWFCLRISRWLGQEKEEYVA